MEIHRLHAELLERKVRVLVVGCGGTGSVIAGEITLPKRQIYPVSHTHDV
jgi:molybdopterin/thiamine biosynthesis adenylyltransferase